MALTEYNKKNLPEKLDTLKSLIDEREAALTSLRDEKRSFIESKDAEIQKVENELKELKLKAAGILKIPTNRLENKGKVESTLKKEKEPKADKEPTA